MVGRSAPVDNGDGLGYYDEPPERAGVDGGRVEDGGVHEEEEGAGGDVVPMRAGGGEETSVEGAEVGFEREGGEGEAVGGVCKG